MAGISRFLAAVTLALAVIVQAVAGGRVPTTLFRRLPGLRRPHAPAAAATVAVTRPPVAPLFMQPEGATPTAPEQLKEEETNLQNLLWHIEALEIRNKAQRGSFIDAQHQWEKGNSEEDRQYLLMKPRVVARLDEVRRLLTGA
jgi:hypothetical protein